MDVQVLAECQKRGHEQVCFFHYPQVGLKAIVAIHSTVLGPSLGGCRMKVYTSEAEAIDDVMRLSEGMTYKSSIAGLDLGGGKSCIVADPSMTEGRAELFKQFGDCLNQLNGRYITAEDMGTCVEDMKWVREVTDHAAGYAIEDGGSGDPSPWTARGVFFAIKAACKRRYGSEDLSSRHVAIQGAGHVGMYLTELLRNEGAKVTVTDTKASTIESAVKKFGAEGVELESIYDVDCDVFAPCAIGQTVNSTTIPRLRCEIIAGAANNQLPDSSVYEIIAARKMLYCPDFVINSGGVISVGAELIPGGWKESWVTTKVQQIYDTTMKVLDESESRGRFPEIVALELAKERIAAKQA